MLTEHPVEQREFGGLAFFGPESVVEQGFEGGVRGHGGRKSPIINLPIINRGAWKKFYGRGRWAVGLAPTHCASGTSFGDWKIDDW